ncbi:hypothetical protein SRCM101294_01286 [Bacillus amyloliquefaciens]|nr:hypothetical protein SRCM101294_01286 [Bacillus amyloliquefaciens]
MLRASFIQKRRYRGSGFRKAKHVEEECPEQMNPVTASVSIGAGSMTFTRKRCHSFTCRCFIHQSEKSIILFIESDAFVY